jgi:Fic family protein
MSIYNWQKADWPHFHYDLSQSQDTLLAIAEQTGLIQGKLVHLSEDAQTETYINILIEEALNTSKIEGEYLNLSDIRSSIRNKLGLHKARLPVQDKRAQDIIELLFDVRKTFKQKLTEEKLCAWHLMLFSHSQNFNLKIGAWRQGKEPMQIVSSHSGRWIVHYEAPPAKTVPKEMIAFIDWFNKTAPGQAKEIKFAAVRAAITHLYFESIHPFEDGNGRIGRALSEKALSQGFGYPILFSLSQAIELDKNAYYTALHAASKSNEISEWIKYFVTLILTAQKELEKQINFILKKSAFFDRYHKDLNARELKVIERMLKEGINGFEGGMSAKKYMAITATSKATATRDLQHLLTIAAVTQTGSGPSVRYQLNL